MGRRILVIDDEDDIREVAEVSLSVMGGYDVVTADSGPVGVLTARSQQPDAILLDVMMPEMDGLEVVSRLGADDATRNIPVILLTAKVQPADRRRFADLGVAGVIPKPFDPVALPLQIASTLGWE